MARRKANGEGTIYRRKDGRYEGAVWVQTTSGVPKRRSVYGKTRAEVDTRLTNLKVKEQQGIPAADRSWRLGEYLDYWLEQVVKVTRRPATYAQCETIVRLYLKPGLGEQKLHQISMPTVQRFVGSLLIDGHSISKMHVVRKVLSSALTRAEREELVNRNVARLVELPSYEPAEVHPWTVPEAKAFLNAATGSLYDAAYFLLLFYGLRRGEVLGLRWQDVDFVGGVLRVRQQLQRVGHNLLIGPLKTRASQRELPLLPAVTAVLTKHRKHSVTSTDHDLVFPTSTGTPTDPRNFVRAFDQLCERYGLRRIKVHALRHTTATLLKDGGVADRDIQRILGHARVTTTQELYQHSDLTSRREGLKQLEAAFQHDRPEHKSSQSVETGSLMVAGDGNGSRQVSRQTAHLVDQFTSLVSGAGEETLTLDLFLGKSTLYGVADRITEARRLYAVRARQHALGIVAVNLAVNQQHAATP
jgi:integrase